jgi:RNA methyltransferase, TrmH family
MKLIKSRDNPQIKALVKLAASSQERRRTGHTLLEGERLVRAFRDSGGTAETIFAGESALAAAGVRDLLENAPARSRFALADLLVERISQLVSAAGVAAVVKTPDPGPLPRKPSNCLLLEGIQDPGNMGSILRTAAAAGISQVYLAGNSVFAWSPKVVRAGMGAHFSLSIFEGVELDQVVGAFDGTIVAMEPRARDSIYSLDLMGPVAWLFGNEGGGLSAGAQRLATRRARIPMPGVAESLNVAAAAAICLFEQLRQREAS